MSVTLQSVLEKLGDQAQLTGGRIIIVHNGKHVDVGGLSMSDAVFSLTEAGKALLDGLPEDTKPKAAKAKTDKDPVKKESAKVDVDLGDLDSLDLSKE